MRETVSEEQMTESVLGNAPLTRLSASISWVIPDNPPSRGPVDFFAAFKSALSQNDKSSQVCIVDRSNWGLWNSDAYPYEYELQGEGQGISYEIDVTRFCVTMDAPERYAGWKPFSKIVRQGMTLLAQALEQTVGINHFSSAELTYCDEFSPMHLQGESPSSFIRNTLGFSSDLPDRLTHDMPGTDDHILLSIRRVLNERGLSANITVNDTSFGTDAVDPADGVSLQTTISSATPILATPDDAMQCFDDLHQWSHALFFSLISPMEHRFSEAEALS